MTTKTMAEVLAKHLLVVVDDRCSCDEMFYDSRLTGRQIEHEHSLHVEERLSAAGFGLVAAAAAAGVYALENVWGSGGRVTIKATEATQAASEMLAGEWDSLIKCEMAFHPRRLPARAKTVRGEG